MSPSASDHREAGEAGLGARLLDVDRSGARRDRDESVARQQHLVDRALRRTPSAPDTSPYSCASSRPSRRDSSTSPATSSWLKVEATSLLDSTRSARMIRSAAPLRITTNGLQDRHDGEHERAEHQCGTLGADQREVLGHHLAEHHVEEHDDRHGDDERDRVDQSVRDVEPLEDRLEQVRDRGLADGTETQRADRDAELCRGDDQGQALDGAQGHPRGGRAGLDARLELRTPCRDQGELRTDEQCVERQQHDGRARSRSPGLMRPPPSTLDGQRDPVDAAALHAVDPQRDRRAARAPRRRRRDARDAVRPRHRVRRCVRARRGSSPAIVS